MANCIVERASHQTSDIASVCDLYCGDRESETYDYLLRHAETPLQVPFYYLDLIRKRNIEHPESNRDRPTAEQVKLAYRAILQRAPEDPAVITHQIECCSNTAQLFTALQSSQEAMLRMPELFSRAFPLVRRLWHVHIPKTAGTTFFAAAVENGWGYVNTNMLGGAIGDLTKVARGVRLCPEPRGHVIVTGHWRLQQHLANIEPFDDVVAMVREPLDCFVSEFNFAVDVVSGRLAEHTSDPSNFLKRGLDPESFERSYERGFFFDNVQCSFLSAEATCKAALDNVAACNAQLLPSSGANMLTAKYFPAAVPTKQNASHRYMRVEDISPALREQILVANHHDVVLFEIAAARFKQMRRGATGAY